MHKINDSHQHFLCFVKPCRIFVFCMLLFFLFLVQNKCWKSLQIQLWDAYTVRGSVFSFFVQQTKLRNSKIEKIQNHPSTSAHWRGVYKCLHRIRYAKKIFAPKMGGGYKIPTEFCKKTCVYKGRGCGYKGRSKT